MVEAIRAFPGEITTTPLWAAIVEPPSCGSSSASAGPSEPPSQKRGVDSRQDREDSSEELLPEEALTEIDAISISRTEGRRCLHRVGQCYRKPGVRYKMYEAIGASLPPPTCDGDYCRDCRRTDEPVRGVVLDGARYGSDAGSSRRTRSASSTSSSARSHCLGQERGSA